MDAGTPRWQRHFLALLPDAAARAALAALAVPKGARPVHPDDLHLTLAFLGTLAPEGEASSIAAATAALSGMPLPEVRLDRLECWHESRVCCATESTPSTALGEFAARFAAVLADRGLGAAAGPPFRAHVTLARLGRGAPPPDGPLVPALSWRPEGLALLASGAIPQPGARYRVLQRIR